MQGGSLFVHILCVILDYFIYFNSYSIRVLNLKFKVMAGSNRVGLFSGAINSCPLGAIEGLVLSTLQSMD